MNIMSLAMNFLTPAIVSRISSALGIESSLAQKAIAAALPTILGGIIGKSSSPSGLDTLGGLLGKQDPGLLGNLGNLIGGSGQSAMVSAGSAALGSLFGNSTLGSLAGAVSKFSGVGQQQSSSLLGMLAPVALGTIAQQQKAGGLDSAGLAKMLMGQKDNVASAIPAGFGDLLKGTGLLDGISVPAAAQRAAPQPTTPAKSGGLPKWLPWALAAAVALLGWNLLSSRAPTAPTVPKIVYNNTDVGAQAAGIYESLKTSIAGIKDEASAKTNLPKLQDASGKLDMLRELAGKMPAAEKSNLAKLIAGYIPALRGLIQTALNAAGVPAVAKPVLDQILDKLEAMAKA